VFSRQGGRHNEIRFRAIINSKLSFQHREFHIGMERHGTRPPFSAKIAEKDGARTPPATGAMLYHSIELKTQARRPF
jgi:hypothetical protein